MPSQTGSLAVTGDPAADRLLNTDPLALLVGMLLDQQVPMEWAFRGPATLVNRLGGLDAGAVADMDPEAFLEACRAKPAIHRFPRSMAAVSRTCAATWSTTTAVTQPTFGGERPTGPTCRGGCEPCPATAQRKQ